MTGETICDAIAAAMNDDTGDAQRTAARTATATATTPATYSPNATADGTPASYATRPRPTLSFAYSGRFVWARTVARSRQAWGPTMTVATSASPPARVTATNAARYRPVSAAQAIEIAGWILIVVPRPRTAPRTAGRSIERQPITNSS